MKKLFTFFALLLTLAVFTNLGFLCNSGSAAEDITPITIGAILEATGTGAAWGIPRAEAIQIAVYQIEKNGGFEVNGKKYKFVLDSSDNRSKPDEAVIIAKRLLDTEGVKFLYDGGNSPTSLAVSQLVKGRPILHMALSTIHQTFIGTSGYEKSFNTWKPDFGANGIAANLARIIAKTKPDIKSVAFLFMNDAQGKMLMPIYGDELKANGIDVIAEEYYTAGTIDYYAQLSQIFQKKPDLLFMGINDQEVAAMLKQALQIGFKNFATCRVQPGIPSERIDEIADGYFFGMVDRDFTDPAELEGEGVKQYLEDYRTLFKKDPDFTIMNRAVAAYEPIYALAEAMKKAGTVDDVEAITKELHGMTFQGKIWTIQFDENGQMTNDYYIFYTHNGELVKEKIIP